MLNASHEAVYTFVDLVAALCCLRYLRLCFEVISALTVSARFSGCRLRTAAARVWFGLDVGLVLGGCWIQQCCPVSPVL